MSTYYYIFAKQENGGYFMLSETCGSHVISQAIDKISPWEQIAEISPQRWERIDEWFDNSVEDYNHMLANIQEQMDTLKAWDAPLNERMEQFTELQNDRENVLAELSDLREARSRLDVFRHLPDAPTLYAGCEIPHPTDADIKT